MKFDGEKGAFSESFSRQLQTILENSAIESLVKFNFVLPGNSRFPYTDSNYLYNELNLTLKSFYPLGAKVVYIVPNSNDDHYIEVGALVIF